MEPFVKERPGDGGPPWHSRQYQTLPPVYVQNASLEIAWSRVASEMRSISGDVVSPFLTEGDEGFDINNMEEWWLAEHMLASGSGTVPTVSETPFAQ
jgi:CMP-N-acetylneuraminic acid synthetase